MVSKNKPFKNKLSGLLLIIAASFLFPGLAFSSAKTSHQHLKEIYHAQPFTFFSKQRFSEQGEVETALCENCPKTTLKIQWIPIVPLNEFVQHKLCYQEKICTNAKGERFKGIRCCQKQDSDVQALQKDMHNLVPELPSLKKKRSQFIEHHPALKGMIARAYLYIAKTYHMPLTPTQQALYEKWDQQYPPTDFEKFRNDKIKQVQGHENPYIT